MSAVSRVLVRALCNSLTQQTSAADTNSSEGIGQIRLLRFLSTAIREAGSEQRFRWARCGFAKDLVGQPSTVLDQDNYGDDACFIAHHEAGDVVGVADGVGGWRTHGVDPSRFSRSLMRRCAELVNAGTFQPHQPSQILSQAYHQVLVEAGRTDAASSSAPFGSSTACVVVLDPHAGQIHTANLGDSGFLLIRGGRVIHRSQEQCHYFNTPYQLSIPPPSFQCLRDSPDSADQTSFPVQAGDFLLVATDGLFDNLPVDFIEEQLGTLKEPTDTDLQGAANSIALQARQLGFDETYMSPFAKKATESGYRAAIGGKPDDVTVILALVAEKVTAKGEKVGKGEKGVTGGVPVEEDEGETGKLGLASMRMSLPCFDDPLALRTA